MSKLVPMEEAARLLGISIERLSEMRSKNEVFGYRDGPNWKFKVTELERVAAEMGISLGGDNVLEDLADRSGSNFLVTDSAKEMLLDDVSEQSGLSGLSGLFEDDEENTANPAKGGDPATGKSDEYSEMESVELMEDSSVELFKKGSNAGGSDIDFGLSDIQSEPESIELELADSGILKSSNKFRDEREIVPSDEDVFDDEEDLSFGASSIRLASGSSRKLTGDNDDVLDEPSDSKKSPSDTGKMLGSDPNLSDDLLGDELSLSDSGSFDDDGMELSSDFTDSGEMVMEDSDSSTEVKLEESGINLSANDSGILLSGNSDASGSDIYSLELPEEDDDLIVVEGSSDDEFNLTPLADPLEEDESTGSQVIALEDSEIYADESSDSILGEEEFQAQPAMLDDGFGLGDEEMAGFGPGLDPVGRMVPEEAPYSLWSVLSLAGLALFLMLGGMVAYAACQNMWMPDGQVANRSVLNFFLKIAGLNT